LTITILFTILNELLVVRTVGRFHKTAQQRHAIVLPIAMATLHALEEIEPALVEVNHARPAIVMRLEQDNRLDTEMILSTVHGMHLISGTGDTTETW
jgi:hypothetical protein